MQVRYYALTGGAYAPSPGTIYPTLTLLADMGEIEERETDGARKQFAVTEAGRRTLDDAKDQVAALIERLTSIGEGRRRSDATSVRRAMGNLREVLINRLARDELAPEDLHRIVALIDEVSQKIERL